MNSLDIVKFFRSACPAVAGLLIAWLLANGNPAQAADRVVAANYDPLMIEGDAERPGYAVEVLHEAARRAGRTVEIRFLPYQRAIFEIRTHGSTMMPALFQGKRSDDDFLWVAQIQQANLRFATKTVAIDDIAAARGLNTIVVESGTTAEALLARLRFHNVVAVSTPEASARMLSSGRADAWLQDDRLMQRTWDQFELPDKITTGGYTFEIPIYLVASPTLPKDQAKAYRDAVRSMRTDGTLDALWAKYNIATD